MGVSGEVVARALALVVMAVSLLPPSASSNSEGDALYALRQSLSDPENVLQSWDPTLVNPCTWFHITCNQDNRVTRLDLGNSNLSGHLVPDLGKLKHLQYLELYKNDIQGTIPAELGNLKNLISLDLYNNNISGSIPPALGKMKSLVFLRLNDNKLSGRIPRELAGVTSLKVVDVSNNDFCGTIPTTGSFEHIPLNKLLFSLCFLRLVFQPGINLPFLQLVKSPLCFKMTKLGWLKLCIYIILKIALMPTILQNEGEVMTPEFQPVFGPSTFHQKAS